MILTHAHYQVQYGYKGSYSVWVSPEHDVAKANIVVCGNVARGDTSKRSFVIQLDVIHHFESEGKVPKQDMDTQEADDGEISKHAV